VVTDHNINTGVMVIGSAHSAHVDINCENPSTYQFSSLTKQSLIYFSVNARWLQQNNNKAPNQFALYTSGHGGHCTPGLHKPCAPRARRSGSYLLEGKALQLGRTLRTHWRAAVPPNN